MALIAATWRGNSGRWDQILSGCSFDFASQDSRGLRMFFLSSACELILLPDSARSSIRSRAIEG